MRRKLKKFENHCFGGVDWLSSISGSKVVAKKGKKIRKSPEIPLGIMYKISSENILRLLFPHESFQVMYCICQ